MWDWFIDLLFQILAGIQSFVGDWGLAIIILTFIVRLLLTPLMIKSSVSNARMQIMQPKIKQIQERYADDPERMNEEMRRIYSEEGFNPLGGCLPILLQMPIFFALFAVFRERVPEDACFYNILPSLGTSASEMFAKGDLVAALPYILFVILFGVLTFLPMMMNLKNQAEETRSQSMIMGVVMSVMMLWFGWGVPSAVLLYYVTSNLWQTVQQKFITQRVIDAEKAKAEAAEVLKPVEVDVVRREKKKRPHKKA